MSTPVARTRRTGSESRRSKFDRIVDPDGLLSPEERAYRATLAQEAHYSRTAAKSRSRRRSSQRGNGGDF